MKKLQSAKDLFKDKISELLLKDIAYEQTYKQICSKPSVWNNTPLELWTKKNVEEANKTASAAIRNTLPFSKRHAIMSKYNEFFEALFAKFNIPELKMEKLSERAEVEIELLKLMQGGTNPDINSRSREALADKLNFSEVALKRHIGRLLDGEELLGSKVQIKALERRKNIYDSTIHPVFLALNLSEVNFLVNHLRLQFRETEFEGIAQRISHDIYRQLSDYAVERIDKVADNNEIEFYDYQLKDGYRPEIETQDIPYLSKMGRCQLRNKFDGNYAENGRIAWTENGYSFIGENGTNEVLTENFLSEHEIKPIR